MKKLKKTSVKLPKGEEVLGGLSEINEKRLRKIEQSKTTRKTTRKSTRSTKKRTKTSIRATAQKTIRRTSKTRKTS